VSNATLLILDVCIACLENRLQLQK